MYLCHEKWMSRKGKEEVGYFFTKTFTKLIYSMNWRHYTTKEASFEQTLVVMDFALLGKRLRWSGVVCMWLFWGEIHLVVAVALNDNGDRFFDDNGLRDRDWNWVSDRNWYGVGDRNLKKKNINVNEKYEIISALII